ncbi:MAG: PleD family two-component system response regulator [Alphaproteobacteria bacterium]|nr:PleD family two-component system response regulator [Alphaproteobacteria bacterium]
MSARILIVDDNPVNVKLLSAKLSLDYYIISTATNGVEAVDKAAREQPDLILLDVMMPEMDGFEACQRLKADPATSHIPIVMLTALSDVADRVRGLAAGADDFLGKPINDVALMARIRSLLRLKVLMDEWRLREQTAQQLSPSDALPPAAPVDLQGSRVLIVDDQQADGDFIDDALRPLSVTIARVGTIADAERELAARDIDLIFSSLDLQNEDGLMICPRLRANAASRHIPILLLGNPEDLPRVAKGLDLGANDYLMRPFDTQELFARARTQLRHKRNYDTLRHGFEQNMKMALVDPLTGAFNRRYLDAHMPRFLRHAAETRNSLSVQMVDIDHFKKINDTYGHAAGDAVLREVALRITNGIRPSDFMVRMGGEEFAIVMPGTFLPHAAKIAERLRQTIAGTLIPLPDGKNSVHVTVSIGISDARADLEDEANKIFERADAALYRAKQSGRNQVVTDVVC